jgi:phospholipid/cholesterol/gamma-HCH transport system permease protein
MIIGTVGGYIIAMTGVVLPSEYIEGLHYFFVNDEISYSLIKMVVFAFLITSISAFYGYYAAGNSLAVGRASTRAVVASSIAIMISNLIITQLMRG